MSHKDLLKIIDFKKLIVNRMNLPKMEYFGIFGFVRVASLLLYITIHQFP